MYIYIYYIYIYAIYIYIYILYVIYIPSLANDKNHLKPTAWFPFAQGTRASVPWLAASPIGYINDGNVLENQIECWLTEVPGNCKWMLLNEIVQYSRVLHHQGWQGSVPLIHLGNEAHKNYSPSYHAYKSNLQVENRGLLEGRLMLIFTKPSYWLHNYEGLGGPTLFWPRYILARLAAGSMSPTMPPMGFAMPPIMVLPIRPWMRVSTSKALGNMLTSSQTSANHWESNHHPRV